MPPRKPPARPRKRPAAEALEAYRAKRDWNHTSEPEPVASAKDGNLYVVQEHHARSHHFDLRLEMGGVLKSWAVPKGPSMDPAIKRLAVEVEDHPLEYAGFQGTIPEGQYGAGTVAIWDVGTWDPLPGSTACREALAKGKLKFRINGERLRGGFLLTRIHDDSARQPNWLLRKLKDDPGLIGGLAPADGAPVKPQLAKLADSVPRGPDWFHEIKFDGYRVIVTKRKGKVTMLTRGGHDWTDRFGKLADRFAALSKFDFRIDGEVVAFDAKHRSHFGKLQAILKDPSGSAELSFAAFDILSFKGRDMMPLPLAERKNALRDLIPDGHSGIVYSNHWKGHAEGLQLFKQACELDMEGIISKPADSRYLPGSRQGWRKIKCHARQEFLICGFTPPKSGCPAFGALILGSCDHGELIYRGRVGTGFSSAGREELLDLMLRHKTDSSPFDRSVPGERRATWLRPELVAEVKFSELTNDGHIRHGSFIGLREDKNPTQVHMEHAEPESPKTPPAGVTISNPQRIIYPSLGITKLEVARYFEMIAPLILPHIVKRPLAFLRAPTGIEGEIFFQKHFSSALPPGIQSRTIVSGGKKSRVCYLTDVKGLVSAVQHGVLEFHPWGSSLDRPDKPDRLIWDLDPGENVQWQEVLGTAFLLRDLLEDLGLASAVKTSGGKGLHVIVFCRAAHDWTVAKPFTKKIAEMLVDKNPRKLTVEVSKDKRVGRIYIDWLRNGRGATCVAPWCVRARPGASVSLPYNWAELARAEPGQLEFTRTPAEEPEEWAFRAANKQNIPIGLLRDLGVAT